MRDEKRDVYCAHHDSGALAIDGKDGLFTQEPETNLFGGFYWARYVPHAQLVEAEHSASVHREMFCEAVDAETKCRAELIETRKQLVEFKERAQFAERSRDALAVQLALYSELERQLADEQERHAQLQSRCYEGFPSVSDGIFDALREADSKLAEMTAERDALRRSLEITNESWQHAAIELAVLP